jgi:hypothetical protein
MEGIIHIQISDRDLNIKLQKDIFNMVTTDNFKLHDEYVKDLVTLDKDEKIANEFVN